MPQRRTSLFVGLTLPLLLFACGRSSSPSEADPYADGQSYPWQEVNLAPQALTPGTNTLQYESPTFARNSWGPVEKNTSNGEQKAGDGKPLTLGGRVYAQGYGVHAGSELKFSLKGTAGAQCSNFTAQVGVDDEVGSRGSVVFQVYGDGIKLYDSGVMTGTSATKRVNVGVVGRQELRLVVTDGGNGISSDHADWADPKLECATQKPKAGSLDTSWGEVPGFPDVTGYWPSYEVALEPDNNVLIKVFTGDILERQPDGKRLVVTNLPDGGRFEVRRYNVDGSPDASYGQGGKTVTDFGSLQSSPFEYGSGYGANDAVLQPDGKLIVVGMGIGPSGSTDFALARYNANGSLDTSFGSGGRVFTDIAPFQYNPYPDQPPPGSDEGADQVKLGPNGTIVVEGPYRNMFFPRTAAAMARYRADGSLDTSFAGIGLTQVSGDGGVGFVVEPNGDMILAYAGRATTYVGVNVRRLLANGRFGEESGNFFMGEERGPNGIADLVLQADGKIVLVGGTDYLYDSGGPYGPETASGGALVRLNPDLTLDTSFGNGGRVLVVPERRPVGFTGLLKVFIQPDGKIVAVGSTIRRFWP